MFNQLMMMTQTSQMNKAISPNRFLKLILIILLMLCQTNTCYYLCKTCLNSYYYSSGYYDCTSCFSGYYYTSYNYWCYSCSLGCKQCNSYYNCLDPSSSEDSNNNNSASLGVGAIIGICLGAIALILVVVSVYKFCKSQAYQIRQQPSLDAINDNSNIQWKKGLKLQFGQCCSICLQTGNLVLSCGHVTHSNCLMQWVKRNNWCPLCHKAMQLRKITIICLTCRESGEASFQEIHKAEVNKISLCNRCKV